MFKTKKIIVFLFILLISVGGLLIKDRYISKNDIYVLSGQNCENTTDNNSKIKNAEEEKNLKVTNKEITVYISGAVNNPGIVTLNSGERLATAVDKVGGTTEKADLNKVNLAIKIEDEMHYIIPEIGEEINYTSENIKDDIVSKDTTNNSAKININTATIEELDTLPGVGEATANKILNHRKENGNFKSIEEIKNVNGIGDKKFENIRELISVE
ncbi:helix-hairpin-helix domain-containing protein [Terrisporobacter mayombei]|nr:helix-hairpin-helix domain-containing protein [Terrisporobacter mayombei]